MIDFWFDVFLSIIVALATVLADWLASRFITIGRGVEAIHQINKNPGISDGVKTILIQEELQKIYAAREETVLWGSDLAAIAFSLDIAILGVWFSNPHFFPFFSRWNAVGIQREMGVWIILILSHFVLLLLSIIFKHKHGESIERSQYVPPPMERKIQFWVKKNGYMLLSNAIGYTSLLSSFLIITNAFK